MESRQLRVLSLAIALFCPAWSSAQQVDLGFSLDGVECGDEVFGTPGEVIRIGVTVTLEAGEAGVRGWSLSLSGEGAQLAFVEESIAGCDTACASGTVGKPVYLHTVSSVDPELDPADGPLAGGPQGAGIVNAAAVQPPEGILSAGQTSLLRFSIDVTVPTGSEGETVRLFFKNGLRGPGLTTSNAVSIAGQTFDVSDGLGLNECKFTVNPQAFRRGDSNNDSEVDISDAINSLSVLFLGRGEILCEDAADANDDGELDISDAIVTLGHLFLGSPTGLDPPGTRVCGKDPTDDNLGDCIYEVCD